MRSKNYDHTPPHVYLEEQRHLERLHKHGVWKIGKKSLAKFYSGGCVWVLGQDGHWRWGVPGVTDYPTVELLNRIRRSVEARKPTPQARRRSAAD